jgi:hypothetical protein
MRQLGQTIIEVCNILKGAGLMTSVQIHAKRAPGLDPSDTRSYLRRAVKMGLIECVRENETVKYRALPDMAVKMAAEMKRPPILKNLKQYQQPIVNNKKPIVNSGWSLAL